jgi:hypothetical protein
MAKFKMPRILAVPFYVLCVVGFSFLVYFIAKWLGAYSPTAWGVFTTIGLVGAVPVFAWVRQLYWKITKKGDYEEFPKKEE